MKRPAGGLRLSRSAPAADAPRAWAAVNSARATPGRLAGRDAPDHAVSAERPLVVDIDATLVTSHPVSWHVDKRDARPTFKRGFGHHRLWAFADHGQDGTGRPLATLLRPGNAGGNFAADHITVLRQALRQLLAAAGRPHVPVRVAWVAELAASSPSPAAQLDPAAAPCCTSTSPAAGPICS